MRIRAAAALRSLCGPVRSVCPSISITASIHCARAGLDSGAAGVEGRFEQAAAYCAVAAAATNTASWVASHRRLAGLKERQD